MSETVEPPIPLPPAQSGRKLAGFLILTAVIVLAVAVGFAIQYSSTNDGAAIAAVQVNPAYPLIGHYEMIGGNQTVVCDRRSVQAWTDGQSTVTVIVNLGTPGVVDVSIPGNELNGYFPLHMTQQTTIRGTSARFTTWVAATNLRVRVSGFDKHDVGNCSVLPKLR
jgi:hypothetical protein